MAVLFALSLKRHTSVLVQLKIFPCDSA